MVRYNIYIPKNSEKDFTQDHEYCILTDKKKKGKKRIEFHDYEKIYSYPGLYEQLFYKELKCQSPKKVGALLMENLKKHKESINKLKVLDLGAGNGMMGEHLKSLGVKEVHGIDIEKRALYALNRDRPNTYDDYVVDDLTKTNGTLDKHLSKKSLNCLVTVAALGFGDIPPRAFVKAFNHVKNNGWIAFNIKQHFLAESDHSGFSKLVKILVKKKVLHLKEKQRYRHRFSVKGHPLYYIAMVGRKKANIPNEWLGSDKN